MYFIAVLALLLFLVFLIFASRQSASVQRSRKSRREIWQDTGSDFSILSTAPLQDIPHTDAANELSYHHTSVGNHATDNVVDSGVSVSSVDFGTNYDSGGGDLGSALADAIDGGGSSFSGFDSGSDFGGGGDFSGGSDFGGGSTTDGSTS
jgi:hypothetical protein